MSEARVTVDEEVIGEIGLGWLVLLGVGKDDTLEIADALADKVLGLRCFEDADRKTNLSVRDVGGALLVVSQFTLYADTRRGRRPGFSDAAQPDTARPLVDAFCDAVRRAGLPVEGGRFGAHMRVSLLNDGPFTIWLDSAS
ncbi:MAG: D-aminoacyl-tRNA deacylase [Chloroflexota bacterium]